MPVELTAEQQSVIMEIVQGIAKKGVPVQTLGGYAGTGNDFIILI
jgi:orotate phosphoribosyltransferase-like protein